MTTYSYTAQTMTLDGSGNATAVSSSVVQLFAGGSWGGFGSGYSNWDDTTDTTLWWSSWGLLIDGVPLAALPEVRWALADDGTRQTVVMEIQVGNSLTVIRVDGDALPLGTVAAANRWLDNVTLSRIESGEWDAEGPMLLSAFDALRSLTETDNVVLPTFLGDQNGDFLISLDEAPMFRDANVDGQITLDEMDPFFATTGEGNDTVQGSNWFDVLNGGDGNDLLRTGGNPGWDAQQWDTSGNPYDSWWDVYSFPAEFNWNDFALGGAGNDTIEANSAGDAWIDGGDGDDRIVLAAAGFFEVHGGAGNDRMQGGNLGFESFYGDDGNDTIIGGNGTNTGSGGAGNDSIVGGANIDDFDGGLGNDRMFGAGGADYLNGQEGNDFLVGAAGQDRLIGGIGADTIEGGGGRDDLSGGEGADAFVFRAGFGRDVLRDFSASDGDVLRISLALTAGADTATEVVDQFAMIEFGHVVLDFGGGNRIILMSVANEAALSGAIVLI